MNTVNDFLKKYESEVEITESCKVRFLLTNHEISQNLSLLNAYYNGLSYQKAKARSSAKSDFDFGEFAPYIREDKCDKSKVFCKVTKLTLNKDAAEVRKHLSGRRFLHKLHDKQLNKRGKKVDDVDYASLNEEDDSDQEMEGDAAVDFDNDFEVVPICVSSESEAEDTEMEERAVVTSKPNDRPIKQIRRRDANPSKQSAKKQRLLETQ